MYLFMWGYLFLFVKMGVVKVNKIYRTVYNEITHTWVAVNETAKQNRKSSGTVVNCTNAGVSSLKSKSYPLTAVVAALALAIPFMANEAQAGVLCKDSSNQVFARDNSCGGSETLILRLDGGDPIAGTPNANGIALEGGKVIGTTNQPSIAIGRGAHAFKREKQSNSSDNYSEVSGAIAIGNNAWSLTPYAITIGSAGSGQQGLGGRTGDDGKTPAKDPRPQGTRRDFESPSQKTQGSSWRRCRC